MGDFPSDLISLHEAIAMHGGGEFGPSRSRERVEDALLAGRFGPLPGGGAWQVNRKSWPINPPPGFNRADEYSEVEDIGAAWDIMRAQFMDDRETFYDLFSRTYFVSSGAVIAWVKDESLSMDIEASGALPESDKWTLPDGLKVGTASYKMSVFALEIINRPENRAKALEGIWETVASLTPQIQVGVKQRNGKDYSSNTIRDRVKLPDGYGHTRTTYRKTSRAGKS